MKVVHISKSDQGGAAKSALRLHISLIKQRIDSNFLVATKSKFDTENIVEIALPLSKIGHFTKKFLNSISLCLRISNRKTEKIEKLNQVLCSYLKQKKQRLKNDSFLMGKKNDCEIYTFPQSDYQLHNCPEVMEADIINLHWTGSFLDWPSFFRNIKKPIVWTLHDMNPFMGGYHYFGDLIKNKDEMEWVENELIRIKTKALESKPNITIVSPSKWLKAESEKSLIFKNFKHFHIPYGLPTNIFKPFEKSFSKKVFNLPLDKKTLLFVAENFNNKRKGFLTLLRALSEIKDQNINLAIIGKGERLNLNLPCHYLGYINDERLLALAYSAADVFIIPSAEDNLPNTVLESLACGTPVVGYNIGGIPDMITSGQNGFLAKYLTVSSLLESLKTALKKDFCRETISRNAIIRYNLSLQAVRYLKLYHQLL